MWFCTHMIQRTSSYADLMHAEGLFCTEVGGMFPWLVGSSIGLVSQGSLVQLQTRWIFNCLFFLAKIFLSTCLFILWLFEDRQKCDNGV